MSQERRCPQCGAELPANAPQGLCPACLLERGLESQRPAEGSAAAPQGSAGFTPPLIEDLAPYFPNLEILELLGQGGMGAVYKARQRELDRLVALKVLPPGIGYDAAFAERFKREARSLARLNHPSIVAVYDFGQAAGLYYFVMEYVDGVNLRQMERTERLAPREALGIVVQVCEALQFAHDEGIVHRDIKPENILLDKKGRVKIADFGLAKLLGRTPADFTLTQPQQVMGTPAYMAPEQLEHPAEVDQRADIYSLGVVFYEMLTGELPLGRFAPPSQKFQVDVRLDEVVLKALEKEPARRYQHASEVKTDVEEISRGPQPAAALALAAQVPDVVLRQRWTGITLAFITLAEVAFLGLQTGHLISSWFVVLAAMGGASLAWWWYLLAKSPDRPRSFADFFRTMLGPHSRVKRLALPLGIFLGACAVAAIAVSAADVGDAAITVVIAIPLVIGPYLLMAVLWRTYRPAAKAALAPVAQAREGMPVSPADRVRRPATGMIVGAAINVAFLFVILGIFLAFYSGVEYAVGILAMSLGAIGTGVLIIVGAWQMMRLRSYRLAVAASALFGHGVIVLISLGSIAYGVLLFVPAIALLGLRWRWVAVAGNIFAMLPISPAVVIGGPVAIWGLVALARPDVRAAFAAEAEKAALGAPSRRQARRMGLALVGWLAVGGVAAALALVLLDECVPARYIVQDECYMDPISASMRVPDTGANWTADRGYFLECHATGEGWTWGRSPPSRGLERQRLVLRFLPPNAGPSIGVLGQMEIDLRTLGYKYRGRDGVETAAETGLDPKVILAWMKAGGAGELVAGPGFPAELLTEAAPDGPRAHAEAANLDELARNWRWQSPEERIDRSVFVPRGVGGQSKKVAPVPWVEPAVWTILAAAWLALGALWLRRLRQPQVKAAFGAAEGGSAR
ncbi:MAG: bifunctional serine/threonine protein kinase/MFS transporter [Planctomycetota bacterium]|nr:bifunctional serine/threonine protein kinase/MFS transporter [Planctomycetota bacterium]